VPPAPPVQSPTLRSLAEARHFAMGAAVNEGALASDAQYRQILADEYNSIVAEDAMKFERLHPSPTQYFFPVADELVAFAQANGMIIHGTTIVWHIALPAWLAGGTFTKSQLLAILKDYIETVVGRYRGKIATWDVVNEVISDDGVGLRNSLWLRVIGPEYIDSAFVWANRADPAAKLYLNETGIEAQHAKSNLALSLVQGLKARGIPVHGVGFEAHFTVTLGAPNDIRATLARFANAGFDIRVSEMDVAIADGADASELTRQAIIYRDVLDACLLLTRCTGFTTWGFTDRYSWIPSYFPGMGRGLPFDTNYQHKPAYDSLLARLREP
jgi:GH35 family endo-1,4-beta-xylanase